MNKKCAIFFLFTALSIVLLHNFFPHHHHEADHLSTEHHHSHDAKHSEDHHNILHLLADLIHATDDVIFLKGQNFNNAFLKQQLDFIALIPSVIIIPQVDVLELKHEVFIREIYINKYCLRFTGLRGPPQMA